MKFLYYIINALFVCVGLYRLNKGAEQNDIDIIGLASLVAGLAGMLYTGIFSVMGGMM